MDPLAPPSPVTPLPPNPKIVFLDRIAIRAQLRTPSLPHQWTEYPTTSPEDLVPRLQGATIAVTNRARIGDQQLSHLPDLRLIAVSATGYDCIDVAACRRHNVLVTNLQDWSTTSVAEHAFSLILALRRQLFLYRPLVASGAWQRSSFYGLLENPIPGDLFGATLGIVGNGNLGQRIATLGAAFGMSPLIADRKGASTPRPGRVRFEQVLERADVLCIACPITPDTLGLLGAAELARMKPTALLINCARGGIVDDAALASALQQGRLGGAGLDVLEREPPTNGNPLLDLDLPNLIVTPHMAFASEVALKNLAEQLIANIESFLSGIPRNVVS